MVTFVQFVLSYHFSQSFTGILFQSNVLCCSEGHCHLTDFGIAKMAAKVTLGSTFAQMVNSSWAAPELDQPEQKRSKQSDVFSFACTIYEVLVYYFLDLSLLFTYLCAKDVYPTSPL
jgi:serine/threonine protein kinase